MHAFLEKGSHSKSTNGMQLGARATFLGRLKKIGSFQPSLYPFVLGLCLEAKVIKWKTIGDAKNGKTSSPGQGLIFQFRRDWPNNVIDILSFIELLLYVRHILGPEETVVINIRSLLSCSLCSGWGNRNNQVKND